MKRILLREPKDPFEVVSPERTLETNLIGDNSGNLIFLETAHKLLATSDATVTPDRFAAHRLGADRINERFDVYVVPLANAFRPSFEPNLIALTNVIRELTIPVVVLGVGAQGTAAYDAARMAPMEASVRAFMSAVLDRAPSVGVRGEFTYDYLRGLGFRDLEVIGCPSMFLDGPRLTVERRVPALDAGSPIAINVSPYVKAMGPIMLSNLERYPDMRYVAQDVVTLETLLWGDPDPTRRAAPGVPVHTDHPAFTDRRVDLYVDPWPWIDALRQVDFAFGTRIHGNIAALLAGTPAVVLAHDSRTLELARYFEIPHRLIADLPPDVDAADLYEAADFDALTEGHAARFATFASFLATHGLRHVFLEGEDPAAFDRRAAATAFPPAVGYTGERRLGTVARRARRFSGRVRRAWQRRGSTIA